MQQKFITIGNSVGIIIPQAMRQQAGIGSGDGVKVEYIEQKFVVTPVKKKKQNKSGITTKFAQMVDEFVTEHQDVLEELAKK